MRDGMTVAEARKEMQKEREEIATMERTAWDLRAAWTVTQEQESRLDRKQKQIDEDMKKLEQEKKDLERKHDVPKLLAKISDLQCQLQTKKKRQRSHREQEERRTKMREEDKKSKENKPPTQTKRQKGSE